MSLGFVTLPLDPAALRALADASYSIVDQALRTPGLLIVQAPDDAGAAPALVPGLPQPQPDAGAAPVEPEAEVLPPGKE